MLFSIIIPTCNRINDLVKCLNSIKVSIDYSELNTDLNNRNCEVIVSDDGDFKKSVSKLSDLYEWVTFIQGPKKGPAANRNNGAKMANGEWLVFTDDDCIASKQWLTSYISLINNHSDIQAIEGSIVPLDNLKGDLIDCPVNLDGGNFWSANIAINSSLFKMIGGFDELYPYAANEDQDIKIAIEKLTNIVFCKNSVIYHPLRKLSTVQAISNINRRSLSWGYFVAKNGNEIGINNTKELLKHHYCFNGRTLIRNLMELKFKSFFVILIHILFGVLTTIFAYQKYNKKIRSI